MQINNTNIIFTSRNATIRLADDIARKVNNTFPRISKSKIENFSNYNKNGFLNFKLREHTRQLRNAKNSYFRNATHTVQKLLAFITPIKEKKIGNCAESAQLSAIAAKMNGIEDCTIARLRSKNGDNLDHQVLLVNSKNPYIIDSWLGFADYVPNALEKYKSEYRHFFNFSKQTEQGLQFIIDKEDIYDNFLRKKINEEDLSRLKKMYPELIE